MFVAPLDLACGPDAKLAFAGGGLLLCRPPSSVTVQLHEHCRPHLLCCNNMVGGSFAWSAGQHLSALGNLASKLERLERQAELLDTLQKEEEDNQVGRQQKILHYISGL